MGYSFDGLTKRITLTSGTTAFSTNDIYSRWKDWVRAGNANWLPAFTGIGGEPIGGGLTSGFYLFLQNGWSIIPDNVDHTLTVQGNLVRSPDDLSGVPVFQQVSSSVLIIQQASAVAIGYSTGGGTTLTPTDISAISASVESQLSDDFAAIPSAVEAQLADDFANIDVSVSVSPQQIRDAMKLAPSAGDPQIGSIDAVLELVKDQAIIAAQNTQT